MPSIAEIIPAIRRHAHSFSRGSLRGGVEIDDLVQEGLIIAHQCMGQFDPKGSATFSTWIRNRLVWHWTEYVQEQTIGPNADVRLWRRKNGKAEDFGEVSLAEAFGESWERYLEGRAADDYEIAAQHPVDQKRVAQVRRLIEKILADADDGKFIEKLETKNGAPTFYLNIHLANRRQRFGSYKTLAEAKIARTEALKYMLFRLEDGEYE